MTTKDVTIGTREASLQDDRTQPGMSAGINESVISGPSGIGWEQKASTQYMMPTHRVKQPSRKMALAMLKKKQDL